MQFVDSKTKKKAPLFIVNMKHSSCTQMSLSNQATFCWLTQHGQLEPMTKTACKIVCSYAKFPISINLDLESKKILNNV